MILKIKKRMKEKIKIKDKKIVYAIRNKGMFFFCFLFVFIYLLIYRSWLTHSRLNRFNSKNAFFFCLKIWRKRNSFFSPSHIS